MQIGLLIVAAIAATARADTGPLMMGCQDGWQLFHSPYEASCLKVMPQPMIFDEAFKACSALHGASMLSLSHRMDKVYFVNKLITDTVKNSEASVWFTDKIFTSPPEGPEGPEPPLAHVLKPEDWMVILVSADPRKVEIKANATVVPRGFVCEAPAHPALQRPQFQVEPDHLFIADFLVNPAASTPAPSPDREPREPKGPKPFIATFNCLAYGLPKPTIEWHLIYKADNQSLITQLINAKAITDPREPLNNPSLTSVAFFNLQRDCKDKCPPGSVQERSQLIVVNPQFMDLAKGVVCLARNEFGPVLSREAQIIVISMEDFAVKEDKVTAKAGISTIVPNAIKTRPDAAAVECYRVMKHGDEGPAQMIPIEELNKIEQGGIQLSRATLDLIIDFPRPELTGDYLCRARLHNGRRGHVTREKTISLTVAPCAKADGCDPEAKPVAVAAGFPAVLSMNPYDNHAIRAFDDFVLECPCTGKRRPDEQLTVNWNLRNRTDLAVVEIPLAPRGSALLLTKATHETHSGLYHCQCVRGDQKSEWRSVSVQVLPSLVPADLRSVLTAKAGEKLTYACRVDAEVPNLGVFVEPLRGAETLPDYMARTDNKRIEIVRDGPNQFSVNFGEAKEADSGIYGCRVTVNFLGKWIEHDTYYTSIMVEKS